MIVMKTLEVGTLLQQSSSNGLGNWYYQVTEVKGNFCVISQIDSEVTKRQNNGWDYYTKPKANSFKGQPMKRMIKSFTDGTLYVKPSKTEVAFIWDGKEKWNSHLD